MIICINSVVIETDGFRGFEAFRNGEDLKATTSLVLVIWSLGDLMGQKILRFHRLQGQEVNFIWAGCKVVLGPRRAREVEAGNLPALGWCCLICVPLYGQPAL